MPCFVNEIFTIGDELVAGEVTLEELFEKAVNADLSAVLENEVDVSSPDTSGEEEAVDPEEEAWQEAEHLSEEQAAIRRFLIARIAKAGDATRTATADLYAAAKDFDAFFKEMNVSQFGKLLHEALDNADGVKHKKTRNFRGFQGIRLKNPVEVTLPDSAE